MTTGGVAGVDCWAYLPEQERVWLSALWGKSAGRAGGTVNLLLSHMLDTAAVAALIWDEYLAESVRWQVSEAAGSGEAGRRLFVWLCGVHDLGKATPAFQCVDAEGAAPVRAVGLVWDEALVKVHRWRHEHAGAKVLEEFLKRAGWSAAQRVSRCTGRVNPPPRGPVRESRLSSLLATDARVRAAVEVLTAGRTTIVVGTAPRSVI
ncbi:CRISPR-associated endonuclease Cas3'' [Nocardia sp. NPDC059246]|uniref:CRISPR-associated endonuclease Cas3'' n=1 Tax=unclassified Nocardia TaxID=2637762 RepID=UPI0036770806